MMKIKMYILIIFLLIILSGCNKKNTQISTNDIDSIEILVGEEAAKTVITDPQHIDAITTKLNSTKHMKIESDNAIQLKGPDIQFCFIYKDSSQISYSYFASKKVAYYLEYKITFENDIYVELSKLKDLTP